MLPAVHRPIDVAHPAESNFGFLELFLQQRHAGRRAKTQGLLEHRDGVFVTALLFQDPSEGFSGWRRR